MATNTVRVTTDRYGRLTATSKLTFGDVTVPVPPQGISRAPQHRILAAMQEVGVAPATTCDDHRRYDQHITIVVRPAEES